MTELKDYGPEPFVVDIEEATKENTNYRTAFWTGQHLQMTLMSIPVGGEIGLEVHPDNDQFLRVEQGTGKVQMGEAEDDLAFEQVAEEDFGIFIPAGKWHNVTNTGDEELKIYSIYSPVHHEHGTVHATKEESDAAEAEEHDHAYN